MRTKELLQKSGVLRQGAAKGTYKSAADMPEGLMMEGMNNKPNKATSKSVDTKQTYIGKPKGKNTKKYLLYGATGLVLLLVIGSIFSTPSAERVFNDSLENMLQTESVAIEQRFKGAGQELESIEMTATNRLDLSSTENLAAQGEFSIDLTTDGVPIRATAEYLSVNGNNYIRFKQLTTSNQELNVSLQPVEQALKDSWLKARDGDSFANFVDIPLDALLTITALPFANLDKETRDAVVEVLQDETAFTIVESADVNIDGRKAYRYELEFSQEKQAEISNKLRESVSYLRSGSTDDSTDIEKLELWVDIDTKRFIKYEYAGVASQGVVEATVSFSDYGASYDITQPDEYFIESELLQ